MAWGAALPAMISSNLVLADAGNAQDREVEAKAGPPLFVPDSCTGTPPCVQFGGACPDRTKTRKAVMRPRGIPVQEKGRRLYCRCLPL